MSYKSAILLALQTLSSPHGCTAVEIRSFLQSLPRFASSFDNSSFLQSLMEGVESGALIQMGRGYVLEEGWREKPWLEEGERREATDNNAAPVRPAVPYAPMYQQRMMYNPYMAPVAPYNYGQPYHSANVMRSAGQPPQPFFNEAAALPGQQAQQPQPSPKPAASNAANAGYAGRSRMPLPVNGEDESERKRMIRLAMRLEGDLNMIMKAENNGGGPQGGATSGAVVPNPLANASGGADSNPSRTDAADVITLDGDSPKKRPGQSVAESSKRPKFTPTLPKGGKVVNTQQQSFAKGSKEQESWIQTVVDASRAEGGEEDEGSNSLAGTFVKGMLKVDHTVLNQAIQGPTIQKCIANTIAPGLGIPPHLLSEKQWEGYVKLSSDSVTKLAKEIVAQMTSGVRSALKVACKEMDENHLGILKREKEKWEKEKQSEEKASSAANNPTVEAKETLKENTLRHRIAQLEKQLAVETQRRTTQLSEMERLHLSFSEEYEREHLEFVSSLQKKHELTVDALKNEIEEMKRTHEEIIETYLDASVETVRAILETERRRV